MNVPIPNGVDADPIARRRTSGLEIPLRPRTEGSEVALTAMQAGWLRAARENGFNARMCALAVRILGPLSSDVLIKSVQALVQRHESLRTRVVLVNDIPRQIVETEHKGKVNIIDLTGMPPSQAGAKAMQLAQEFIDQKIDILMDPFFDARLLRISSTEHALIVMIDHIISDAVSCSIISRELWDLYSEALLGDSPPRAPLRVQFHDYAMWQAQIDDSWRKDHEPYWENRLKGAPSSRIPLDGGLAKLERPVGSRLHFCLGSELSMALHALAMQQQVSLPVVVLAIHSLVMSRWCTQDDLVLSFVSHGRDRPELRDMVGFLAAIMYLRIQVDRKGNFIDHLKQISAELSAASFHRHYSCYSVSDCKTEIGFNWLPMNWNRGSGAHRTALPSSLRLLPLPVKSVWPLLFGPFYYDTSAGVCVTVHFRSDSLKPETIRRFWRNLRRASSTVVAESQECLDAVLRELE